MLKEKPSMIPYPFDKVSDFWEDVFHDINYDGIIFICGKTKDEKFFTIRRLARHELSDYLKTFEILPALDYYFTINQFIKKKGGVSRRGNNFFATAGTIIDIDIHNKRMPQELITKNLASYKAKLDTLIALDEAFPYQYCINSGRGLQFVYIYQRAINFKLQIMHTRIQELLLRQHSQLLADNPEIQAKLDAGATKKLSGLYRMPGTYHSKTTNPVTYTKTAFHYLDTSKIIDNFGFYDEPPNSRRVSAYHINPHFESSQKRKSCNNISHFRKMITAVYNYQKDHYSYYHQNPGHENRNCTCFVLIHLLLEIMSYEDALQEILAFNQKFYVPLPEKRLRTMLDYAYENYLNDEKYKMRFLKTSTILTMLNLENGEYGIYDTSEARKKAEEERATRREQKTNRDKIICDLFHHGMEYKEIAKQADCSLRTVHRIINKHCQRKHGQNDKYEEIAKLYLTGMPYAEIASQTSVALRTVNNVIATVYPKETRPHPWREMGMTKEDFYKQYKKNNP